MRWCKYCNSDSKTAKKKGMEEVDCLVYEKIFPKQATGSQLSFHPPFISSVQCRHQGKPDWFSGVLPALPKRLRAEDNCSRVVQKSSFRPSAKWNSLMARERDGRDFRWANRERRGCLIRTLHLNQGEMSLFHWGRKFVMAAFVQVLRRECGVWVGLQEAGKGLGGQKEGRVQWSEIKTPKLQNHFATCQTLHKSTYGGIQKNKLDN